MYQYKVFAQMVDIWRFGACCLNREKGFLILCSSLIRSSSLFSDGKFGRVVVITRCCTLPCAILANISLIVYILLLFHSPEGSWNKLQNMRNSENIFHIGRWEPIFVTSCVNDVKFSNAGVSKFMNEVMI